MICRYINQKLHSRKGCFETMKETYRSRVYTDRPAYADFDAPAKFQAINSIVERRLVEHPNAICCYSGGADSDIMIDVIERARTGLGLPPIKYMFSNTGLEMKATKDHVRDIAAKYGVEIEEVRPKVNIVTAVRKYGEPFISKVASDYLGRWQKKGFPLDIVEEFNQSTDKLAKLEELNERYPGRKTIIQFFCGCNNRGEICKNTQLSIYTSKFLLDFIKEFPPDFTISSKCCDCCKKRPAHKLQKNYEMVITGERMAEGGIRAVCKAKNISMCFSETSSGQYRFRPLIYVTDKDKAWYKDYYGITYSDAYEVYGLTRTGCCGCPISYKAVDDLEKIRPYESNLVKAAWNVFGKSYDYRAKYIAYKAARMKAEQEEWKAEAKGGYQITIFDLIGGTR